MKTALNTREPRIICPTLKILQQMILLGPMVGQALVPYYRQVRCFWFLLLVWQKGYSSSLGLEVLWFRAFNFFVKRLNSQSTLRFRATLARQLEQNHVVLIHVAFKSLPRV